MNHNWPSRQVSVCGCVILVGAAWAWLLVPRTGCRTIEAAFWFEDVSYNAGRLGGSLTDRDMESITATAWSEVSTAFAGLNIRFSDRRDARYRVRVVQELRDLRFRRVVAIPAESRAVSGVGGQGAVNFSWLASSAVAYASDDAERSAVIDAIGKGIGRATVHELVHILLPRAPIHDSKDIGSYEYESAARREQYIGRMHWNLAWPLLQERIKYCGAAQSAS